MARYSFLTDIIAPLANAISIPGDGDTVFVGSNAHLIGGEGSGSGGRHGISSIHANTRADVAGYVFGDRGASFLLTVGPTSTSTLNVLAGGAVIGSTAGVWSNSNGLRVTNHGEISGGAFGVDAQSTTLTLLNYGLITASGTGVNAAGTAFLVNDGLISADYALVMNAISTVTNTGTIVGTTLAVFLNAGGTLTNHGEISGATGFSSFGAATVTNYGSISGTVAVSLSFVSDALTNLGLIDGLVQMGLGDDVLDSGSGRINGLIDLDQGNDGFVGGQWSDVVQGGAGADDLDGGGGNDRFVAIDADGEDVIVGGAGLDVYDARLLTTVGAVVNLTTGEARMGGETDLLSGIEWVFGSDGMADRLTGDAFANLIRGGGGNDTLDGAAGNDLLQGGFDVDLVSGGDGRDRLFGDGGRDRLFGGLGNDVITGGDDCDVMTGDAGADRFDFNDFNEFLAQSPGGLERITDFTKGQDLIDLSTIDADITLAGNDAFAFVGTGAVNDFGELNYRFVGATTVIGIGYNAATRFDILRLDGNLVLTAADFLL